MTKRMTTIAVVFLGVLAEATALHAQPVEGFRATLDTYLERLTHFGYAGSILVGGPDSPLYARGYGLADREREHPFLPSTVVTVGSITKSFTAAAILRLQETGRVRIDDSIDRYLPGVPPDKRAITLHQLLTHTSGLKRNGLDGGDFNLDATRSAVLADALDSELIATPGERYAYSNLGYGLLAMIVEEVAGIGYETFIRQSLLYPARMYRTGYVETSYQDSELAAGYRAGARLDPVVRQPALSDGPTWNLRGNGGLHSDAFDMYRWYRVLAGPAILGESTLEAMTHRQVPIPGTDGAYGYGLEVATTGRGTRDVSHSGGNGYFSADFHMFLDEGFMFFISANDASRVNMSRLSGTIEAILVGREVRLPPAVVTLVPGRLRALAGTYELQDGDRVEVEVGDGVLRATAHGDRAIQALIGGDVGSAEGSALAERSRTLVEAEFEGDFRPKHEAMGGSVSLDDLERYHGYDRDVWDREFGAMQRAEIVAQGSADDEVRVILRIEFERGAAGQVHTWRNGRLANVSVIPDFGELEMTRTLHPTSSGAFQSFDQGSDIRLEVTFEDENDEGPVRLVIVDQGVAGIRSVGG